MEISISLNPASGKNHKKYLEFLNRVQGISLHADVMSETPMEEYSYLVKNSSHPIDVHIMVDDYRPYLAKVVLGSIRSFSIHAERGTPADVEAIKLMDIKGGVVIDLDTAIESVDIGMLTIADVITVMSVRAGKSGQEFNEAALGKVRWLRRRFRNKKIIIDGGVNPESMQLVRTVDVDVSVVGAYAYDAFCNGTKDEQQVAEFLDTL